MNVTFTRPWRQYSTGETVSTDEMQEGIVTGLLQRGMAVRAPDGEAQPLHIGDDRPPPLPKVKVDVPEPTPAPKTARDAANEAAAAMPSTPNAFADVNSRTGPVATNRLGQTPLQQAGTSRHPAVRSVNREGVTDVPAGSHGPVAPEATPVVPRDPSDLQTNAAGVAAAQTGGDIRSTVDPITNPPAPLPGSRAVPEPAAPNVTGGEGQPVGNLTTAKTQAPTAVGQVSSVAQPEAGKPSTATPPAATSVTTNAGGKDTTVQKPQTAAEKKAAEEAAKKNAANKPTAPAANKAMQPGDTRKA